MVERLSLAAARVNAGLSQKEAAEAIGCSRAALMNYENGRSIPNVIIGMKMADVYGVSMETLIFCRDIKRKL